MLHFAVQARAFFFRELLHATVFGHGFQQFQALDGFLERCPVGQRAAQPAVIYKKSAAALGLFGDCFLGLTLGAHKQNASALRGDVSNEAAGFAKHFESFLKVNDVDAVAFPENIFLHFRVPAACLVTEVDSGLQQFFHRNFYCQVPS